MSKKKIKKALVSVYHKDNLDKIIKSLHSLGVEFISTGGTKSFIESLDIPCRSVEDLTGYPSILGGRVKTLHPKVFGGILNRSDDASDQAQMEQFSIPDIDLVIVDLYPFEATVATSTQESEIIEKIDIGGISLIRAAAKNYKDVLIVASQAQYEPFFDLISEEGAETSIEARRWFAKEAFAVSSHYDTAIFNYFDKESFSAFRCSENNAKVLRYGENPHQRAVFFGKFDDMFEQVQGKEISYNNLLDIDAAINLINDFEDITFAILKHNNACGIASRPNLSDAWQAALSADPVSAFGGVLVTNAIVDKKTAEGINEIFFEIIIAPDYDLDAIEVLSQKKNRIILIQKNNKLKAEQARTILNGVLLQDKDLKIETPDDLNVVTQQSPTADEIEDLLFANKVVKHSKSNAIVIARNRQLYASGVGQTSRVDALRQAIDKAKSFDFDLEGAVMASDAFFPFADCVQIAQEEGIKAIIQPGGSIRDKDSIEACDEKGTAMVVTGYRHFKH